MGGQLLTRRKAALPAIGQNTCLGCTWHTVSIQGYRYTSAMQPRLFKVGVAHSPVIICPHRIPEVGDILCLGPKSFDKVCMIMLIVPSEANMWLQECGVQQLVPPVIALVYM